MRFSNLQFAICILQFAIVGLAPQGAVANPPKFTSPLSPKDSLQYIRVPEGFEVELVAHEPNIVDPVAIRFDEDGRLWVVEMRDYPTFETKGVVGRSRISILRDENGDGFYEKASVFVDDLPYATGLQPWKGGVFVTMAGQVAYLKDTDGDDKADVRETWYTGFTEGNTQLRANHPQLGLDNHIYIANGLRGGAVRDAQQPEREPVSISGMDFRFDPFTRDCTAVSGSGQFGLTFDDFGNRFICSNRNPAMHVVLEDRDLKKNPLVTVPAVTVDVAKAGADSRVYPLGRSWTTSHLHAGQFTAACGVHVYRGDALPQDFYGNLFVCDPTGHLVHREIMKPKGVTFASTPAYDKTEFFGSPDEWCSPVNLDIGPDGALYVVDMYRAVIEHPDWMPAELRKRPDQMKGNDLGRIYRVVPKDFRGPNSRRSTTGRPQLLPLSSGSNKELVDLLAHPNAWYRETAARLLLERQDKSIRWPLVQTVVRSSSIYARIHALWLLHGLQLVDDDLLLRILADKTTHPRVLEQATIVAGLDEKRSAKLVNQIAQLRHYPDARVRFHALLAIRQLPRAPAFPADQWELDAIQIAADDQAGTLLAELLTNPESMKWYVGNPGEFVASLARMAAASDAVKQHQAAVDALLANSEFQRVGLNSFFAEFTRSANSMEDLRSQLDGDRWRGIQQALRSAQATAQDASAAEEDRVSAVGLLAFDPEAADELTQFALEGEPQSVRLAAIAALSKHGDAGPWANLLEQFSAQTPAAQRAILDGALTSAARCETLLDAIAAGHVKPTEVDQARMKLLIEHREPNIQKRAKELFASAVPADREKALAEYRAVLAMKPDVKRGRTIFEKTCATCHRIDDMGIQVGADISDLREKTAEQVLTDIIQPNRAIDANYFSYTATTTEGVSHTGILAAETSNNITLKLADGKEVTLRRDEIDDLHSNGISFMPDGLEKNIPLQDMADLVGFVKNWRYLKGGPEAAAVGSE